VNGKQAAGPENTEMDSEKPPQVNVLKGTGRKDNDIRAYS